MRLHFGGLIVRIFELSKFANLVFINMYVCVALHAASYCALLFCIIENMSMCGRVKHASFRESEIGVIVTAHYGEEYWLSID